MLLQDRIVMRLIFVLMFLTACQALPLIIKEAEEIAVEEAVEIEVHKEKDSLNLHVDVKKEETATQQVNHAASEVREPEGDRGER
jgi:hypothetical protein